jgi:DNA repair protein RadC
MTAALRWNFSQSHGQSAREKERYMRSQYLYTRGEAGEFIAATSEEIVAAAKVHLSHRLRRGATLNSPRATRDFLSLKLGVLDHEVFAVIFLDKRHRVISYSEMFRGTLDGASVHPREVVKEALRLNAAAVILAHPHPSGVAEPSQADEHITGRLKEALALIDVRVLDHIIIGGGDTTSMAERGLL